MNAGSVGMFWWLSLWWRGGWRGIYSLHTKSNRYTQKSQLGQTECINSVRLIQFKMWTLGFSMGPKWSTRWDRWARVRAKLDLSLSDYFNSVRPISVIRKQRDGQANSVGPIAPFGDTKTLRKRNREFALWTRWDRPLISVRPKSYEGKQRVCSPISVRPRSLSVRPDWLGLWLWLCQMNSVAPDRMFRWGRVWLLVWSISLSILSKQPIKQHLIPF